MRLSRRWCASSAANWPPPSTERQRPGKVYALDSATIGLIYAVLSMGLAAFVALASRQAEGQNGGYTL